MHSVHPNSTGQQWACPEDPSISRLRSSWSAGSSQHVHCSPVAPTVTSPCGERSAFVANEGGGRCVRGLDRPSPCVLQVQRPGQAAGRIGWGCHGRPLTPTWNAIGLSLPVVFDARDAIGSLSPWHSFLPPQGGGGSVSHRAEIGAWSLSRRPISGSPPT
jgi:hypothetical protein